VLLTQRRTCALQSPVTPACCALSLLLLLLLWVRAPGRLRATWRHTAPAAPPCARGPAVTGTQHSTARHGTAQHGKEAATGPSVSHRTRDSCRDSSWSMSRPKKPRLQVSCVRAQGSGGPLKPKTHHGCLLVVRPGREVCTMADQQPGRLHVPTAAGVVQGCGTQVQAEARTHSSSKQQQQIAKRLSA
jgi:hypothetical protein